MTGIGIRILEAGRGRRIEEVRSLFRAYAGSLGFDLDFQGFDRELEDLPGMYRTPEGGLLLARVGGKPAGCVAMRPLSGEICEMKRLYVLPDFRGRGIGRKLARRILDCARKAGYRKMRLDTVPDMADARALYEGLGFYPIPAYCFNPIPGALFLEIDL